VVLDPQLSGSKLDPYDIMLGRESCGVETSSQHREND